MTHAFGVPVATCMIFSCKNEERSLCFGICMKVQEVNGNGDFLLFFCFFEISNARFLRNIALLYRIYYPRVCMQNPRQLCFLASSETF